MKRAHRHPLYYAGLVTLKEPIWRLLTFLGTRKDPLEKKKKKKERNSDVQQKGMNEAGQKDLGSARIAALQ